MLHHYRVTKYDPAKRGPNGAFIPNTWTSRSDIGRCFGGRKLSEAEYLAVESAYLFAIEEFLREAGISALFLRGVENQGGSQLPEFVEEGARLEMEQSVEFARLALREQVWARLVLPRRAFVHFGRDYYLYVGVSRRCERAIAAVESRGLFVESFRSPYSRRVGIRLALPSVTRLDELSFHRHHAASRLPMTE